MSFLPNLLGFLRPLGYTPPQNKSEWNIFDDFQERPYTYLALPAGFIAHYSMNLIFIKNPNNMAKRAYFAPGVLWRLPICLVLCYGVSDWLNEKRKALVIQNDLAVHDIIKRYPREFRDLTEKKKTYQKHFGDYIPTNL